MATDRTSVSRNQFAPARPLLPGESETPEQQFARGVQDFQWAVAMLNTAVNNLGAGDFLPVKKWTKLYRKARALQKPASELVRKHLATKGARP